MIERQVNRNHDDKPTRRCPHHMGLAAFANVGGRYCIHDCEFFGGINPQRDSIYCTKEGPAID